MAANGTPKPLKVGDKVVVMNPKLSRKVWTKGVINRVYNNTVDVKLEGVAIGTDSYHMLIGFNEWATGVIVVRYTGKQPTDPARLLALRLAYRAKTAALATKRSLAKLAALKASNKTI